MFPGRRAHSSLGGWRRLRATVGLLLHCRALSGKSRRASLYRARLVGQGEREGSEWEQGTTWNKQAHENVNVQGTRGRVTNQLKKTEQGQIQYSEKYFNDIYKYRHVAKLLPKNGLLCEVIYSLRASDVQLNITSKLHWFFPLNLCFGLAQLKSFPRDLEHQIVLASDVQLNIISKLHWFFPLNLCFGLAQLKSFPRDLEHQIVLSLNSLDNVSKVRHPVLSCGSRWIQYAFAAANLQGFGSGRRWRSVTMIGVHYCVDDPSVAFSTLVSLDGLLKQLRVLKSVMVDWWWGIVEGYGGHEYNWNGYKRLF
ncbi:hypothetical protein C1H46_015411 [Malus baccata]|uniref:Uncharacterized protein n=1 Tax=Malus baccata TaxID=106549 RepID=A0A540MJJ0_MALBA|nr:hypothetical protein C1H46_015411 [Malus baccata]